MPQPLLLLVVVACGGLLGVQARVNGELAARLHSALDAAAVSFLGGTLILLVIVVCARRRRAAVARLRIAPTRWWWWLGGLGGAAVVAATAQGVPLVGVALVSVCVVAGTAMGALVADMAGLGPGGRHGLTPPRIAGAALAVVAVGLGAAGDRHASVRPGLFALLFAAGAVSAVQPAAAGRIRDAAADATVAAAVSFSVAVLVLGVLVMSTGQALDRHWPQAWWLYTGGAAGAVYIAVVAVVVDRLGVLAVSLATVAGQVLTAVMLDAWWPSPGTSLRAATVAGAVLTVLSVGVVAGGGKRTSVAR